MPVPPFTHNHRRTVIDPIGPVQFDDRDEYAILAEQSDRPDWDAVRALIDDYYRNDSFDVTLLVRTDPEARAFDRITHAVDWRADLDEARLELGKALAALSPEERAEYDRRTT